VSEGITQDIEKTHVEPARYAELPAAIGLERLSHLGMLVAEVVHEVRNPMVALKTFLNLLPNQLDDRALCADFLEIAREELQRIERLLDTLLSYSQPARLEATPRACVEEAMRSVELLLSYRANERGVRLDVERQRANGQAAIDPDSLRQILLNLVLNAIDATPSGECVTLRAEPDARWITLCVEDSGRGVPAECREQIFEPFFSTNSNRPGGLGLGISRRLVEAAGGNLTLADRPEGGSSFRIRLPTHA